MFPFTPSTARRAAELPLGIARRAAVLPDRLGRAATVDVEPTPYDVAYRENKLALRRYEPRDGADRSVPVVIAYALINSPAILDLCPERSVVGQFRERGFEVYVIDWGSPSRLDAHLTIADYVRRYMDNCVDVARESAGADAVHLMGISTTSPLAAMYAGTFPAKVATLTMQGPPLSFHASGGMLDFQELVAAADLRVLGSDGNVPAEAVDLGFSLRKPLDAPVRQPLELWRNLGDERYVERMTRIARWSADGPDLAGATHGQFVTDLVGENALMEDTVDLDGRAVELANLDMPVALILGEDDAYVPHEASLPFLDAVPSEDTEVFWVPTDHVGSLVGPPAHEENGWPRVVSWLADRSPPGS